MRRLFNPDPAAKFIMVLLLFVGFASLANAQLLSGITEKVSIKLRNRQQANAAPNNKLRVIVQLNAPPKTHLNSLLRRSGVRVRGDFSELGVVSLELPANILDELALSGSGLRHNG